MQRATVRAGGGHNHRDSLSDAVLIKDNHVAAAGIAKSVERARPAWPGRMIEVECDTSNRSSRRARPARRGWCSTT